MAKRLYPHDRVRRWYAYDLNDICRTFQDRDLHIQTVRKWIKKDGLQPMDSKKPILIYGFELKRFLQKQNLKSKCPTTFEEFFCMSCKDSRSVYRNRIEMAQKSNLLHVKAQCRSCKKTMFKSYKMDAYQELKRKFNVVDVLELYDAAVSPSMTQIQTPHDTPANESHHKDLFS